jgi:mono/diheme cytochrome c family protein
MQNNQRLSRLAATMIFSAALSVLNHAEAQSISPEQTLTLQTSSPRSLASPQSETQPPPASDTQQAMLEPPRMMERTDDKADLIAEGRSIFNGTCSHCHGPDAVTSSRRLDLRQLSHRYGASRATVFDETVTKGRPSKGMPNWSGVLTEEKFSKIYAYLSTIQVD